MGIQKIVSRWGSGLIVYEGEHNSIAMAVSAAVKGGANLRDADLGDANLRDANLRGADLGGANLRYADLGGANLGGADLGGANLRDANLRNANLGGANLSAADLRYADLGGANLGGADLDGANLRDANLRDANLRGADLRDANLSAAKGGELALARTSIVPESGEFIGFKKCVGNTIVTLKILSDSRRSNAFGRKCRAEKCVVLAIDGADHALSMWDPSFVYRIGEVVQCDNWNDDRWVECGGGIHFYLTRIEAENHS